MWTFWKTRKRLKASLEKCRWGSFKTNLNGPQRKTETCKRLRASSNKQRRGSLQPTSTDLNAKCGRFRKLANALGQGTLSQVGYGGARYDCGEWWMTHCEVYTWSRNQLANRCPIAGVNWRGQGKGSCRRNAKEGIEETTFNQSLHPGADYNTTRLRHGPLRSALT